MNPSVVANYGLAVTTYYASATTTYTVCQIVEGLTLVNRYTSCITSTPGYQNLVYGANPHERYVEVVGIDIQVHHGTLLADAQAIIDCA
ncbi:MAG: hypothetical protein M3271_03325 [Actinomycetota bacterium]|nr:hypothetical protein [Actinomycetota bacterium]